MPLLIIRTNQPIPGPETESFLKAASTLTAEALGKSERYVMTLLESGHSMSFAGSTAPCAYLELKSLGLTAEQTPALSAALSALVSKQLEVPLERIYIEFSSPERAFWGWNGGTF